MDNNNTIFYLNGSRVLGLNDINISIESQSKRLEAIGFKEYSNIRANYPVASISFSRAMVDKDFVFNQYSGIGVNGSLIVNSNLDNNISFVSGFLTNYSISFSLNAQPTMNYSLTAYRECGELSPTVYGSGIIDLIQAGSNNFSFSCPATVINGAIYKNSVDPTYFLSTGDRVFYGGLEYNVTGVYSEYKPDNPVFIYKENVVKPISSKTVKLKIDDTEKNRLIGATINYSMPKTPYYIMGEKFPFQVVNNYPYDINCVLEFESEDYSIFVNSGWPIAKIRNILFEIRDIYGHYIDTINLGNMEIVSESISLNKTGPAKITAEYIKV